MSSQNNMDFSHIYIEEEAYDFEITERILKKNKNAKVIGIKHYKDIFNRPRQSIMAQKAAPKLILAVKHSEYIYRLPEICQNYGYKEAFYSSNILNCIYDCDYCYLQGVYGTSNILAFVNLDSFKHAIEDQIGDEKGIVFLSYDSDILALEGRLPFLDSWLKLVEKKPNIEFEIRTKSVNIGKLLELKPAENLTVAWTLSPDEITNSFEMNTPCLDSRIEAMKKLQKAGYRLAIAIDPIIRIKDTIMKYSDLLEYVFKSINGENIRRISLGMFRMPKDYLKKIRKSGKLSEVLYYPYEIKDGIATYSDADMKECLGEIKEKAEKYCSKVYLI